MEIVKEPWWDLGIWWGTPPAVDTPSYPEGAGTDFGRHIQMQRACRPLSEG